MVADPHDLSSKLAAVEERLQILEGRLPSESQWLYLVARPHPWRRQLSLKGRNQTVSQLIKTMRANKLTPEEAANDFDLPVDAIHEALLYFDKNQDLIRLETAEERRRLNERGLSVEPLNLPR